MIKDDIAQQLKIYIPFTSHSEVEQCAEDILQQHNKDMQRLLQQTHVSGSLPPVEAIAFAQWLKHLDIQSADH